jgi:signal transduction histidine kinase
MEQLQALIRDNEEWLMRRALEYARKFDYVKYTSTLAEAWRISIASLSEAIINATRIYSEAPELSPDDDYASDPIARFGMEEARKHRSRGLTLSMFLSLLKYYQQSYVDLIMQSELSSERRGHYRLFVERCFDRIELGLLTEWTAASEKDRLRELQTANRLLANEKNKYLTIFESLHDPVFLLDSCNHIANINYAATQLFFGGGVPGDGYYDGPPSIESLPWLTEALTELAVGRQTSLSFERVLDTTAGVRHFHIKLEQMLDVSEKFSGTVVLLNDLTERKRAAVMEERKRLARELHDSVTQSLYSLTLFAEWGQGLVEVGENKLAGERMARMGEVARQALKEMRLLVYELRPTALEQDGLLGVLQHRLAAVEERSGVTARLLAEPLQDVSPAVEEALYHITQEALNNALKHAAANSVTVRVCQDSDGIMLEVIDDGIGFNPEAVRGKGGIGLVSMQERAEQLGGKLDVISAPGAGARVRATLNVLDHKYTSAIRLPAILTEAL